MCFILSALPAVSNKIRGVVLLLEVVIGLGIFAATLLFVMGIFTISHRTTTSSKNLAVASNLCREVMEQEVVQGYSAVDTRPAVDVPIVATIDGQDVTTVYRVTVEVTQEPAGPPPDNFRRKRLLVTVGWHEGGGTDRTAKLETYVVE